MDIIQEMQELKKKAELYNVLKTNIDKAQEKMREAIELMQNAQKDLDPTIGIKRQIERKQSFTKKDTIDALDEQYKKLQMGIHITKDTIGKDHKEWNDQKVNNFIQTRIKKIPGIQSRRDGMIKEYFLDNTP